MATATFVHDGNAIDYTPGSNVAAGAIVVRYHLVGVANRAIPANTLGALAVAGVFDFPKATGGGTAIPAGRAVYWDTLDEQVVTGSSDVFLGHCVDAAGDDDAVVRVRLNPTHYEAP